MKMETGLVELLDRTDVVGWLSVVLAAIWLLLELFGVQPPWLENIFPQGLLFLVGFLAIYLHRALREIKDSVGKLKEAELIIGNEMIYDAAIGLIQRSPRGSRFWATSFWFYPETKGRSKGSKRYLDSLKMKLRSDQEAEYRRAVSTTTRDGWEILKKDALDLFRVDNIEIRYYFENPLVLDCLIGEEEAIIGMPDRRLYPHLRAAILIRDRKVVEALRQWYQEFIWDAPVDKIRLQKPEDLASLEKRRGWLSYGRAGPPDPAPHSRTGRDSFPSSGS